MSDRSRLLLIAYYFPPLGMGGVQRPLKLAKYLPEFGWDVTVITVAGSSYYAIDESLADELPSSVVVKRVKMRDPGRLLRPKARPSAAPVARHRTPPAWARRIQQIARWPDDKFPFVRPAVRAAERLHDETPFDAVLTTSPPPSVHAAGLRLQKRIKLPWVADFRDPWLVREGDWGPTRIHERYAKRMRAQIIANAGNIIAANDGIAASLRSEHSQNPVEVIHNGFDEADFESVDAKRDASGEFRILLYGTLSHVVDPTSVMRMIAEWRKRNPGRGLRIIHAGLSIGIETETIARAFDLHDVFESTGYLPHRQAIGELCQADAIVIPLTTAPGFESTVPGRIFEAMRSLRPILMVGSTEGEAARILQTIDNSWTVAPDDLNAGLAALDSIAAVPMETPARGIASLAQFERKGQAGRVAGILDSVRHGKRRHNA